MSRFNVDCSTSNINQGEEETFTSKGSKTSQKFYDKSTKNNDNIANSLFQFEMKFDSLKGYVDSVTSAVNQHAALINKLRTDLNAKHSDQNLTCAFTKFASCLNMEDLDSNFMITMVEEIDSKENDKIYQSSVNKFCQKLEGFGNRVVKMNKLNQTLTEKIQNIESDITMKVNGSDFKSKIKRTKTKMIEKIENALNIYDDKIKSIDKNCLEKIQSLEYRMKLMEESKITPNFQAIENNIENLPKPNLSLILKETEEKIQSIDDKIEKITETTLSNIQGININFLTFREETTKNILDFKNTFDGIKILENPIFKDLEKELIKRTSQEIKNFSTQLEKPLTNFNEQIASLHLKIRDLEIFIVRVSTN